MRDRNCWILLHREQVGSTGSSMETRVTLRLGEKSAKALVAEHGHRLVCVRYRYDAAAQVRCKTMEHVVDNSPGARARMPPIQRADRLRRWGCVSHTRIVRCSSELVNWADGGGAGAALVGAAAPHREALGTAGPEGAGPRWRRDWP